MCKHILILAQFSLFFNSENKSTWVFEMPKMLIILMSYLSNSVTKTSLIYLVLINDLQVQILGHLIFRHEIFILLAFTHLQIIQYFHIHDVNLFRTEPGRVPFVQ